MILGQFLVFSMSEKNEHSNSLFSLCRGKPHVSTLNNVRFCFYVLFSMNSISLTGSSCSLFGLKKQLSSSLENTAAYDVSESGENSAAVFLLVPATSNRHGQLSQLYLSLFIVVGMSLVVNDSSILQQME